MSNVKNPMISRKPNRWRRIAVAVVCLGGLLAAGALQNEAEAKLPPGKWVKEYHVQVEYWFWDSDYYYWSTVYSTESAEAAQFVYAISQLAKDNGTLNQLWPSSNWKYIAMDVRLITVWKYVKSPTISPSQTDYQLR